MADKTKVDTGKLEDGKFWIMVERDTKAGKDGISVSALSDVDYAKMMTDFDVEKMGAEILLVHRC